MREIKLNGIASELATLDYPASKREAMEQFDDVVLLYADGREPLRDVIDRINDDEFGSRDELQSELLGNVPVEAVGEPGQSEGDA